MQLVIRLITLAGSWHWRMLQEPILINSNRLPDKQGLVSEREGERERKRKRGERKEGEDIYCVKKETEPTCTYMYMYCQVTNIKF